MGEPRPAPLRLAREGPEIESAPPDSAGPVARDAASFERLITRHLDSAHNLAWWLMRDGHDAADVVQEACLKAWRAFAAMRGSDGRSWLLTIVRNTAMSRLRRGDESGGQFLPESEGSPGAEPWRELLKSADREAIRAAIEQLQPAHREVVVLCDLEGLSYAQIAEVIGAPVGTVMSRVARARDALRLRLKALLGKE
jgi:RNA polymerase sigma-70 factor, ECF subfamily